MEKKLCFVVLVSLINPFGLLIPSIIHGSLINLFVLMEKFLRNCSFMKETFQLFQMEIMFSMLMKLLFVVSTASYSL